MIAVVTGSSGFMGRNLVARLLRDGHEVRCLTRAGSDAPAGCEKFVVDYRSPGTLVNCAALSDADVVLHLAGATRAVREGDFIEANVKPTRHLLGALAERGLAPRFVYVSSLAAAGPAESLERPLGEDDPPRPVESYGRSKLEAERVVESFSDRLPTVIVRPGAVYGPGDRDFLNLFRLARRGWLVYPGVRDHWLSLLHVDDVIEGLLLAATHEGAVRRTFFLGSSQPVQWRHVGQAMAEAAGTRPVEIDVPHALVAAGAMAGEFLGRIAGRATLANRSKAQLGRPPYWVCSSGRIRALGFSESRSLPEGVRDTYLWYEQNGWLGRPLSPARAATEPGGATITR